MLCLHNAKGNVREALYVSCDFLNLPITGSGSSYIWVQLRQRSLHQCAKRSSLNDLRSIFRVRKSDHPCLLQFSHLENGQEVWLQNQDGIVSEFPIKVRVTERIGKDNVYIISHKIYCRDNSSFRVADKLFKIFNKQIRGRPLHSVIITCRLLNFPL